MLDRTEQPVSPSTFTIPAASFVAGTNIIAVEVHQQAINSSDLSFNLQLPGNDVFSSTLTRGPYLQVGSQTAITIRWRTSTTQDSKIELGTVYGTYPIVVNDAAAVTKHIVRATGLTADTKYYYRIGNSSNTQGPDASQFFTTLPAPTTTRKIRITAFGDCGRNNAACQDDNLVNYQNFLTASGIDAPDAWLLLGDNAYSAGTDPEYTANFFKIYGNNILKNHKLYPAPGNHDYGNNAVNKPLRNMPYHTHFSVPQAGECGGVASNKQNYYSYDIGNIHFLSLDSYGTESDGTSMETNGGSALKTWLDADLAVNTRKWIIAYWHHPPYTKSSYNSDTVSDLINIRQNFITFLETRGVDLIICGHAHAYERGYLLRNFTGAWTSFNPATHAVSTSSATYTSNSTCPYVYTTAPATHYNIINGGSANLRSSWPQSGNYTWINTSGTTRTVSVTPPNNSTVNYSVTDAFGCVTDQFTVTTSGVLPVSLISYDAKLVNRKVNITWSTATETNNDHFTVERSTDSRNFTGIGTVRGAGNSTGPMSYEFTDATPLKETSFYRLSQTNFNDNTEYLGIRRIENTSLIDFDVKTLSGYAGKLVLQFNISVTGQYHLNVFDVNGRKWKDESINPATGITRKEMDLKPGVYIWEVKNAKGEALMQKVIVQ